MHSWGFALREGVFAKPKEIYITIQKEREEGALKHAGPAASWSCELLSTGNAYWYWLIGLYTYPMHLATWIFSRVQLRLD